MANIWREVGGGTAGGGGVVQWWKGAAPTIPNNPGHVINSTLTVEGKLLLWIKYDKTNFIKLLKR